MQEALLRLTAYWADRGCLVMQPFNTEVGAGTLNPATYLRVLGPEPWHVAYVEPSVRPDDSRYGDNPNRIQTHTQFQVILKEEPGDPQEQYLGSLAALGVDLAAHDVRFVEDNWESPALGAWGLGWEVWLDGLEITQFTYFQQAGGIALDPVSVEITYGMERILMALQDVRHFKEITYAEVASAPPGGGPATRTAVSYGEVFGQAEYEMSVYYLDQADVDTVRTLFDAYEGEARRLIDARLPVPAHSYVLKCSHAFNVLDSRGAIGTTERARAFARMRGLAHEVAELWLTRREELGFPLLAPVDEADAAGGSAEPAPSTDLPVPDLPSETFLLEIGTEELPAGEIDRLAEQLSVEFARMLDEARLEHGDLRVLATPRRLAVLTDAVATRQPDVERFVRGPQVAAAFDADGRPTKAALGFARSRGVDPTELERVEDNGKSYVGVTVAEAGLPAVQVLAELVPAAVGALRVDRSMRWRAGPTAFSRPIRWLLALYGSEVVDAGYAGLHAGRTTRVFRDAEPPTVTVPHAVDYQTTLRANGIVADRHERRSAVISGATELAASVGGVVDVEGQAELVDEITNLVERPVPVMGAFRRDHLRLPAEVLTTVMRKHQRYLTVLDPNGDLLPHFVTVANGECDHDVTRAGNESVLEARFADAGFFWDRDLARTPQDMAAGLSVLTFEARLGSMRDRADRIAALATELAGPAGLDDIDRGIVERAAPLVKFDLASEMVIEISSLAGVMARVYAHRASLPTPVAEALFECELPRSAGDRLPASRAGAVLAVADRVDLLTALFAVGAQPTGSADPFGLRRAALGLVLILLAEEPSVPMDLGVAVAAARRQLPVESPTEVDGQVLDFVARRLEQHLVDSGHRYDLVRAVLPLAGVPAAARDTLASLERLVGTDRFDRVSEAVKRVGRILTSDAAGAEAAVVLTVDPAGFETDEERRLWQALEDLDDGTAAPTTLELVVDTIDELVPAITAFFDGVMVLTDDADQRRNRLGLLQRVHRIGADRLDWEAIVSG